MQPRIKIDLIKKLENMKADLSHTEAILAAGGFRDADGDWNDLSEAAVARKQGEAAQLKERIASTERQIAEAN